MRGGLPICKIARLKSRVELSNLDAVQFLYKNLQDWRSRTLIYIDPPYYEKGRYLYHDAYDESSHLLVSKAIKNIENMNWIVSYDDVRPIHDLYSESAWLRYTLSYSARNNFRGREAMFFSSGLKIPEVKSPLVEIEREIGVIPRSVSLRKFAA